MSETLVASRWLRRAVPMAFLGLVLVAGTTVRVYGLTAKGLAGSDSLYFTSIAKEWSEGNFVYQIDEDKAYFRPVAFAIFAAGIRAFGYTDYAIKLTNVLVDVLNIVLTFFIAYLIGLRQLWRACSATLAFALLPMAIHMSRVELTHTISTLMLLLSCLSFLLFLEAREWIRATVLLAAAGLFAGFAALTHEELLFLGPGYLLALAARFFAGWREPQWFRRIGRESLAFLIPFLIAAWQLVARHGRSAVESAQVVAGTSEPGFWLVDYLDRCGRFMWDSVLANGSAALLVLFILVSVLAAVQFVRSAVDGREPLLRDALLRCLPLILMATYVVLYAHFFWWYKIRCFLPMMPLVTVSIFLWIDFALARLLPPRVGGRFRDVTALMLALALILCNLAQHGECPKYLHSTSGEWFVLRPQGLSLERGWYEFRSRNFSRSLARRFYDELGDKVSSESKLLVSSSIYDPSPGRRLLQMGCYFGDNAVYVIDHHAESLPEIIARHNVKYVLFTTHQMRTSYLSAKKYRRYLYEGEWESAALNLGAGYGFPQGTYSVPREFDFLKRFMARLGAKELCAGRVPGTSTIFVIWELSPDEGGTPSAAALSVGRPLKPTQAYASERPQERWRPSGRRA